MSRSEDLDYSFSFAKSFCIMNSALWIKEISSILGTGAYSRAEQLERCRGIALIHKCEVMLIIAEVRAIFGDTLHFAMAVHIRQAGLSTSLAGYDRILIGDWIMESCFQKCRTFGTGRHLWPITKTEIAAECTSCAADCCECAIAFREVNRRPYRT